MKLVVVANASEDVERTPTGDLVYDGFRPSSYKIQSTGIPSLRQQRSHSESWSADVDRRGWQFVGNGSHEAFDGRRALPAILQFDDDWELRQSDSEGRRRE